jgi:hypothetical protein
VLFTNPFQFIPIKEHTQMLITMGSVDNFNTVVQPVPDESEQGWHREERLQVSLKLAANERPALIEFRLGEDSQAPSTQLLTQWLESGEVVQAYCTGISARPFVQKEGKTYRTRGKAVELEQQRGDELIKVNANLDAMIVFLGHAMAPLSGGMTAEEALKQTRAAYKRGQRLYRERRNAERAEQMEVQLEERARQMLARRAEQQAQREPATTAAAGNGRKR